MNLYNDEDEFRQWKKMESDEEQLVSSLKEHPELLAKIAEMIKKMR
ncbi:hypothetical protein [Floccifex sp.]|nr:hypothetical protein [Floccifex sp.]MDD7280914.1 hypothetical protein [Erysipelotrichaceae bacterium]MDY2958584.1 hypothetical protein [Floccifex sp.]